MVRAKLKYLAILIIFLCLALASTSLSPILAQPTPGFNPPELWSDYFSDSNHWDDAKYNSTIRFPDLNGDGRADVCGRGPDGILCAISSGTSFNGLKPWATAFSDNRSWDLFQYNSTIQFPDLNKDGMADICARGKDGISCALSYGTGFYPDSLWAAAFNDADDWDKVQYFSTIQFPDLNKDGMADLCARGKDGISCALSYGTGFYPDSLWAAAFNDADDWDKVQYFSTIQFPDLNGDGMADLCARGKDGISCALSYGTGFYPDSLWAAAFSDSNGWGYEWYYSTIQFPDLNKDGMADLCARGKDGISCALSYGTGFYPDSLWAASFSDSNGWGYEWYYSTIHFPDVDGDNMADVCGRGIAGIACDTSSDIGFTNSQPALSEYSDEQNWSAIRYYSSIQFPDLNKDGKADVCGRGPDGILCATSR